MGIQKNRRPTIAPDSSNAQVDVTKEPDKLVYSTTEQDTGEKWVDGKAIYQKTISFAGPLNAYPSLTGLTHGITGMDRVIELKGTVYFVNSWLSLPSSAQTDSKEIGMVIHSTRLDLEAGSFYAFGNLTDLAVTVTYTKV